MRKLEIRDPSNPGEKIRILSKVTSLKQLPSKNLIKTSPGGKFESYITPISA
jgi:hypothetical protein